MTKLYKGDLLANHFTGVAYIIEYARTRCGVPVDFVVSVWEDMGDKLQPLGYRTILTRQKVKHLLGGAFEYIETEEA